MERGSVPFDPPPYKPICGGREEGGSENIFRDFLNFSILVRSIENLNAREGQSAYTNSNHLVDTSALCMYI